VVHSSNSWAEAHIDEDLQQTEIFLRGQLSEISKLKLDQPDHFSLHRWRYALLDKIDDETRDSPYYDEALQLGSVGDWGSQSRIEDVWLESNRLADKIIS
jgi:predicted NAD/FAD-dependent oxidoreductase